MKKRNKDHPYIFRKEKKIIIIALTFLKSRQFIEKVLPFYELFHQNLHETRINEKIERYYENQIAREFKFDITWLEDFREKKLYETHCNKVKPLIETPGLILITNERIYFQSYNNISSKPVKKYNLRNVIHLVRRRYNLRQIGIEFFMKNDKSIFFSFKSVEQRDEVYQILLKQPKLENCFISLKNELKQMTKEWQNGNVSNFDYLLFLNFVSDRSFNDLTQYPVFPWVIADYESNELDLNREKTFRDLKNPIGALNEERLKSFQNRYKEMTHPKFLYGTHYSTPGYVLFYLVRQLPEYMLKLQNGRFDAAEREFHSMKQTWESVLSNTADLKELIPEFFYLPEFLQNRNRIDFGKGQNDERYDDVELPPWAKGDPVLFIRKHRQALESDYVSRHLHHWIDLIFGYKQSGKEAVKNCNVFHYMTYENSEDIDLIDDPYFNSGRDSGYIYNLTQALVL
jgi:factor associated with neutral sphingomyelinase activation